MARLVQNRLQIAVGAPPGGAPPPPPPNADGSVPTPPGANPATQEGPAQARGELPWLRVQDQAVDGYYYYGRCPGGQCQYLAVSQALAGNPPEMLNPAGVAQLRTRADRGGMIDETSTLPPSLSAQQTSFPSTYQARMESVAGSRGPVAGPGGGRRGFVGGGGTAGPAAPTRSPESARLDTMLPDSLSREEKILFEELVAPSHNARQHARQIDQYLNSSPQNPPVGDADAVRSWMANQVMEREIGGHRSQHHNPRQTYDSLLNQHIIQAGERPAENATWPAGRDRNPLHWRPAPWPSDAEEAGRRARGFMRSPESQRLLNPATAQEGDYLRGARESAAVQREQMEQTACLEIIKILMEWAGKLQQLMLEGTKNIPQTVAAVSQAMQRQR